MDRRLTWEQLAEKVKNGTAYDSPVERLLDLFTHQNVGGLRLIWIARDNNNALWVFPRCPKWRDWPSGSGYWWHEQSDADQFRPFELPDETFPHLARGEMFNVVIERCHGLMASLAEIDSEVT